MDVTDSDKIGTEQADSSENQPHSRINQRMWVVAATSGVDLHPVLEMLRCANCSVVSADTVRAWFKTSADPVSFVDAVKNEHRADAPQIIPVVDPENIEMLVATPVEGCGFLLLQSRPETALLSAMAGTSSTSEALERWKRSARSVLQIYYRNRQTATVLSYEFLRRHPQKSADHLRQSLGIDIERSTTVMNVINDGKVSEVLRLVAMQMVSQSSDIRDIIEELDACSAVDLPVDDAIESIDLELVCEELVKNGLHEMASDLAEENQLLLLQLHQVQEELERYYLELQDAVNRRFSLERRLTDWKDKVEKRERELENARNKIEDFRRSTSWRITLPVRILGRLIRRKRS